MIVTQGRKEVVFIEIIFTMKKVINIYRSMTFFFDLFAL